MRPASVLLSFQAFADLLLVPLIILHLGRGHCAVFYSTRPWNHDTAFSCVHIYIYSIYIYSIYVYITSYLISLIYQYIINFIILIFSYPCTSLSIAAPSASALPSAVAWSAPFVPRTVHRNGASETATGDRQGRMATGRRYGGDVGDVGGNLC